MVDNFALAFVSVRTKRSSSSRPHDFLDSIEELLTDTERLMNTNNPTVIDSIVGRLQCAVDTTYQLLLRVDANAATRDLSTLYQELLAILERWENRGRHMSHCCAVAPIENCREFSSGMNFAQVGRPRIDVSGEQIECLRSLGFTWAIIAVMLSLSRTSLWRKCRELGICDRQYTDINNSDLDEVMRDLVTSYPYSDLTILRGHLRPRLYEETLSRVEGSPAYPSYPGRANFSYISLQNLANRLHERQKVGSARRIGSPS